jgi:hypothetical protein
VPLRFAESRSFQQIRCQQWFGDSISRSSQMFFYRVSCENNGRGKTDKTEYDNGNPRDLRNEERDHRRNDMAGKNQAQHKEKGIGCGWARKRTTCTCDKDARNKASCDQPDMLQSGFDFRFHVFSAQRIAISLKMRSVF